MSNVFIYLFFIWIVRKFWITFLKCPQSKIIIVVSPFALSREYSYTKIEHHSDIKVFHLLFQIILWGISFFLVLEKSNEWKRSLIFFNMMVIGQFLIILISWNCSLDISFGWIRFDQSDLDTHLAPTWMIENCFQNYYWPRLQVKSSNMDSYGKYIPSNHSLKLFIKKTYFILERIVTILSFYTYIYIYIESNENFSICYNDNIWPTESRMSLALCVLFDSEWSQPITSCRIDFPIHNTTTPYQLVNFDLILMGVTSLRSHLLASYVPTS